MRTPRRAKGGEIKPLAARMRPIKKIRLFTGEVWLIPVGSVQAAISIGDKEDLSAGGARLTRGMGKQAPPSDSEGTEGFSRALLFGTGAGHEGKVTRHLEATHGERRQSAELELLGDCPARDESDAKSGFDRGLDGFGGVEIHDRLEVFKFEPGFLESSFDDAARARSLLAHQEAGGEKVLGREVSGIGIRRRDQYQFVAHEGLDANSAFARRAFDESDGNLAVEEKLDDLLGVAAVQRELHARMLVEEGPNQARKNVLR